MSTFLQLAQKLRQECGVSTSITSPYPTTCQSQVGELARLVTWIQDAWREIQLKHDNWRWMRGTATVNTVIGTDTYANGAFTDQASNKAISRFARWWADDLVDRPKAYLTSGGSSGQYWLIYWDWRAFKRIYKFGVQQTTQNQPVNITTDDAQNVVLGPIPNDIYTVTLDYQKGPLELTLDGDVPDMPAQFHNLIVYEAMKKYAAFEGAAEVMARATFEAPRMMSDLERSQLQPMRLGGPLA